MCAVSWNLSYGIVYAYYALSVRMNLVVSVYNVYVSGRVNLLVAWWLGVGAGVGVEVFKRVVGCVSV